MAKLTPIGDLVKSVVDGLLYDPDNVEPRFDLPIVPNPGAQEAFVRSEADIVVFGGQAGGGKTWGLLEVPMPWLHVQGYNALIFRRNMSDALKPGAIWPESFLLYQKMGGRANEQRHSWRFKSGATVTIGHLDQESTVYSYQGAQAACLGFDELTHFTEAQFWYMTSRVRSVTGGRKMIRATCNPDPDSFVAKLIEWWIDPETGIAMPERSGVVRWFVRSAEGAITWADDQETLRIEHPEAGRPMSFTFIPSTLDDNPMLSLKDPDYRDRLKMLPLVERERLLGGNWKVRPAAGVIFNRAWFKRLARVPEEVKAVETIRYWDNAGSTGGRADRTAGVRMMKGSDGRYYVTGGIAFREEAPARERIKRQVAEADGNSVTIWLEQEPGSSGKDSAQASIASLAGYIVRSERATGPKVTRWGPFAAQAEAGNVFIVGEERWCDDFVNELHNADGSDRVHDDYADAAAGAFNKLSIRRAPGFA